MKTIEEEAAFLSNKNVLSNINWNDTSELERLKAKYYDGFKAGVEFAQRWISVEDELPEIKNHGFSDLVLTKNSYDNIMLERYDSESKQFNGIRYDCIKNNDGQVTHWRPIELK